MEGDKRGQATFGLLSSKNQLVAVFSTPLAVPTRNDDIPPTADNSAHFFRHSLFDEKRNALKPFDFPLLRVPLNID